MSEAKFDRSRAEAGATNLDFKGGEAVLALLRGLPIGVCMNIVMNTAAIIICERAKTETAAYDEARNFRRNLMRCIAVNWPNIMAERAKKAAEK